MSKSIFGSQIGRKQIYGSACNSTLCNELFPMDSYLDSLSVTIQQMISIIDKFFPETISYANVVADMSATSIASPGLFVRLVWAKRNPGIKFVNNELNSIHLKQIYLEFGLDWKTDPYLI